jgi:integrase
MKLARAHYQNGSLTREERKKGPDVWVFRWREETPAGRVKPKVVVGTVERYPTKAAAQKAVEALRININQNTWMPSTLEQLVTHYRETELPKKAYSTSQVYGFCLDGWILPKWGEYALADIKTVRVEEWLASLDLANGSKSKIRNLMSALFRHAMRHEWIGKNPISLVRQSAKRERQPEVLDVNEIRLLLSRLVAPFSTMVFLIAVTGLRISELLALKWSDINFAAGEINLTRGIVRQHLSEMKTETSRKPIPMDAGLAEVLLDWRLRSAYNQPTDWLFASPKMKGTQPYWPENLLRRHIRPAAIKAGITKTIGWHTFRHSYATILKANGEDVKVIQEGLRHSNCRVTLDVYTQAVTPAKREAQRRVVEQLAKSGQQVAPYGPEQRTAECVSN